MVVNAFFATFAAKKTKTTMAPRKPSIPKGTRDFSTAEMARRNYIFDTIREVFGLYGYRQIETPAMENLSTLMGKYGDEGDKLLFKILNSGDYLRGTDRELIDAGDYVHLTPQISDKGLRYDLTVPFARFVVQHREELQLPFKRFQIQPVWRADRPQKGRYREFYQCDADVVGSDSLLNEVELLQIIDEVFRRLRIRVAIKLNNRKVLAGIAELIGAPDKLIDITVAIDKIDKIGIDKVNEELSERGLGDEAIAALRPILEISGRRIAVWGLAFKPETDDMRCAPALTLIDELLDDGATATVYDPVAMDECRRLLGDSVDYASDMYAATVDADALVLLTEWKEFRLPSWAVIARTMRGKTVIDGRNIYRASDMAGTGLRLYPIGSHPDGIELPENHENDSQNA